VIFGCRYRLFYVVAEKYGKEAASPLLVHAGKEPLKFTNIFPFWRSDRSAVCFFRVSFKL